MAINQNHISEDLDGVKCAIVEKNVSKERTEFLRSILERNGFKVIVVNSPPPKGQPPAPEGSSIILPETFTIGVTDVTFNTTNAIFGRLLKTLEGRVVTLAFWQQKDKQSNDQVPYFDKKKED